MTEPSPWRVSESVHCEASALPYHRHGTAFATIVLEGSYTEVQDNNPHTHAAGSIVFHDTNEEHADYFTSAGRCLNVELHEHASFVPLERIALDATLRLDRTTLNAALARLNERLTMSGVAEAPIRPDWLDAALERFDWLDEQPLRNAATLVGVHQTHFSRVFHHHLGMTPNDYRLRVRVQRASELLLGTTVRIANVAQACGFNDQSHLTRAFGAALGLTPASYRRTFAR
jgi:transcriptional regulator GlxA family with amidase domain